MEGRFYAEEYVTQLRRGAMNRDHIEGRIKQLSGKVKEYWGRLNHDPRYEEVGRREQRMGLLQQRRGILQQQVGRQLDLFQDKTRDWARMPDQRGR